MASLNNKGINVALNTKILPTGYAKPSFSVVQGQYNTLRIEVLKSAVEDADPNTTFDNIIDDGAVGIKKYVEDWIKARYDYQNLDIDYYMIFRELRDNHEREFTSEFFTDQPFKYVCMVELYVNATP